MDCLLIGGASSVGKSESIYRLTKYLISQGFSDVSNSVPNDFKDFKAVIEGNGQSGKPIRIIINTATDTPDIISNFKVFYDKNGTFDMLISSIRDDNFWPRVEFFKIMKISDETHNIIEIPLAKITRRGTNFQIALKWYQDKIDRLIINTLSNRPFMI